MTGDEDDEDGHSIPGGSATSTGEQEVGEEAIFSLSPDVNVESLGVGTSRIPIPSERHSPPSHIFPDRHMMSEVGTNRVPFSVDTRKVHFASPNKFDALNDEGGQTSLKVVRENPKRYTLANPLTNRARRSTSARDDKRKHSSFPKPLGHLSRESETADNFSAPVNALASDPPHKITWLKSYIDSGAARSVCPVKFGAGFGISPTDESQNGEGFRTADGTRVRNHGGRTIRGLNPKNQSMAMNYSVSDVAVALDSVSQICDSGSKVIFHKTGGTFKLPPEPG